MRYKVREIGVLSALRVGMFLGMIVGIVPVLVGMFSMTWFLNRLAGQFMPLNDAEPVAAPPRWSA